MSQSHKNLIPVRRDAVLHGEYPLTELESLLETGALRKTDECFSESKSQWEPILEFIAENRRATTYRTEEEVGKRPESGRRKKFKRKDMAGTEAARKMSALLLNVMIVVAMAAVVGMVFMWGWISIQSGYLRQKDEKIHALQQHTDELMQTHPSLRLLYSDLETADPGVVRGRVIVRGSNGRRKPAADTPLNLYSRATVDSFLNQRYTDVMAQSAGKSPGEIVDGILSGMPQPIEVTTTNMSGFYSFKVPKPGQYVIYARDHGRHGESHIWFVAFDSADRLNTPVDLTELNKVTVFKPDLMVNDGR